MRTIREIQGQERGVGRNVELELVEFDWTETRESATKDARHGKLYYLWGPPKDPPKTKAKRPSSAERWAPKRKKLSTRPIGCAVEKHKALGRFITDGQRCVAFVTGDTIASNDPKQIGLAA